MNFLFVSPHFPPNYYLFCRRLKEAGFTVLAVGEPEYGELAPELAEALDWYYKVPDLHDLEALKDACRFFIEKFGPIHRLDSLNEYWLETEAALRSEFGVPGVQASEVFNIRRKSRMKRVFAAAGIPHARGRVVGSARELLDLAAETGYPVIVKPDDGMGAAETYKLGSEKEALEFFASKPDKDFIAEEFIEGDIVTFDGLTDCTGAPVFYTSHVYGEGVMESVLADSHIYYYSERKVPPDLDAAGRRLLEAFRVRERFFHFEFFRRKDGSLCALEVNMRPPGGFTMDMFDYACDIDAYALWAEAVKGRPLNFTFERKYHCAYVSRKSRLTYRLGAEELAAALGDRLVDSRDLPPVLARAMGEHGYVVRARRLADIRQAIRLIQE